MSTRDQYVASLKNQIDQWNTEIANWESRAKETKKAVKAGLRAQVKSVNAQRELARYNLKLLEGASSAAWSDVRAGADQAFERMQVAMKEARSHFEGSPPAA
jgi:hypothetical protein